MRLRNLLVVVVLGLAACSGSADDPDAEVATQRIVTLSGDLTEFVYELGRGDELVGIDVTTVEPPEALRLPSVGIARFLAPEGVLAVEPTLVLADTQTEPAAALDQIRGAGAEVVVFDTATSFDELYTKVGDVARVLGAEDEGTRLVEQIRAEIATVTPLGNGPRVIYIYTRGPGTLLVFGQGMTTQAIIEGAGATDVGASTGAEGAVPLTPEALVAAAPDVIIVPTEGLAELGGLDALLDLPGVSETPAGANRAILDYPQGDFLTLGPRTAQSLDRLVADLQELGW